MSRVKNLSLGAAVMLLAGAVTACEPEVQHRVNER